jgi:copper(I)-binding protein
MKYLLLLALFFLQGENKILVSDSWLRPAPESFNTAFYCTVINNGDTADTLYKASSSLSDDVQIHETYKRGDMMGMRPVKYLAIAPHDSLKFKPGGYHVMIMNLKEKVEARQTKEVSLYFKKAGEVKVQAVVGNQ